MTLEGHRRNIIIDGESLSTDTIPDCLVGRQDQADRLRSCLTPMLTGQPPLNAWLHGPLGSGKTAMARLIADQTCLGGADHLSVYVNCWQHRTLYGVLQAIIDQFRILGADTQDTDVKFDLIGQSLRGRPVIIVLDEIDRPMPGKRQEITRGVLGLPKAGVICIARSTDSLATLDEGVLSRLSPVLVELPRYSDQELEAILTDRAEQALARGCWSAATVHRIAQNAGGDARMAISALRQAAAAAEQSGRPRLDVRSVQPLMRQWRSIHQKARLAGLLEHEKIIHKLAVRNSPIGATELARLYVSCCRAHGIQPMAMRTFSKYLCRLSSAGLLSVGGHCGSSGGRLVRAA